MSTPQCEELLGPVYSLIEARTRHYSVALQLKGKLDMMTRQITAKPENSEKDEVTKREALLGNFAILIIQFSVTNVIYTINMVCIEL